MPSYQYVAMCHNCQSLSNLCHGMATLDDLAHGLVFEFWGVSLVTHRNSSCAQITGWRCLLHRGKSKDRWKVSFQSRVGREEWLRPYTDETSTEWGKS